MADQGKKTSVVVGGASGIGAAVVADVRARGGSVLVWDVAGSYDVRCDVADPASVDEAMARTREQIGAPAEVTITAGVGHSALLSDLSVDDWDRVMTVNTRGPWLVMRAMARAMREDSLAGSIVATSSISAHLVDRAMGAYCASKAALGMIVRVAATEWASHGIRVNAVGPGVTETPMLGRAPRQSGWLEAVRSRTPLGRLGTAEDIARAIRALHEVDWVTGQVLDCDGGLALHSPIDAFGEGQRSAAGDAKDETESDPS